MVLWWRSRCWCVDLLFPIVSVVCVLGCGGVAVFLDLVLWVFGLCALLSRVCFRVSRMMVWFSGLRVWDG